MDYNNLKKGDAVNNKYEIEKIIGDGERSHEQQLFVEIFDNIFSSIREPLLVLDPDLKVLKANHSFYRTFKVNPGKTEGELIKIFGPTPFNKHSTFNHSHHSPIHN
jgi:PAS domain-containing protein